MPDEGWLEAPTFPVAESGFMKNPTAALAAGQALSDRMRGRAELCRVINRTTSRNDYDTAARTIDALLALAATNHMNDTRRSDSLAQASSPRGRDRGRKLSGARGESWRLGTTAIRL
jgi:hypothetical protein